MPNKQRLIQLRKGIIRKLHSIMRSISRFGGMVFSFLFAIIDQAFGSIPSLFRAHRIISIKIKDKQNENLPTADSRLELPLSYLKEYYTSEIDRLGRIEEKAKSTILGVTIAIMIIATPNILLPTRIDDLALASLKMKWLIVIGLILAVVFLLLSGYLSFLAFSVGEISKPLLGDHPPLKKKDQMRKIYIKYIELNELRIIQRTNFLSASLDCLRNGLVFFLIVLILSLLSIFK